MPVVYMYQQQLIDTVDANGAVLCCVHVWHSHAHTQCMPKRLKHCSKACCKAYVLSPGHALLCTAVSSVTTLTTFLFPDEKACMYLSWGVTACKASCVHPSQPPPRID
jgi:hypothetical protein